MPGDSTPSVRRHNGLCTRLDKSCTILSHAHALWLCWRRHDRLTPCDRFSPADSRKIIVDIIGYTRSMWFYYKYRY